MWTWNLNIVLLKVQTEGWACHYANCIPKFLLQEAEGKFFPSFVTSSTDGKATNKLLVLAKNRRNRSFLNYSPELIFTLIQ